MLLAETFSRHIGQDSTMILKKMILSESCSSVLKMNYKSVVKFFGLICFVLALYHSSSFFLKGMIRYNALLLLFKAQGKKRLISNALILIWFADAFVLFWVLDMLSVVSPNGIPLIVKNIHLFSVTHMVELPNKIITKTWWRLLKRRKPCKDVLDAMRIVAVLAFYHFIKSQKITLKTLFIADFVPCCISRFQSKKALCSKG